MRERQIKKQFYLNEKENYMLKNKCERAGISESTFFRKCITNNSIKEKPDNRFYEILENLRGIATNINQLARNANIDGYVNELQYINLSTEVKKLIANLRESYL